MKHLPQNCSWLKYFCPVFLFSCSPQQTDSQSIGEVVSLMEEARKEPNQAVSLCQQVQESTKQDECLLLALEKTVRKDIEATERICSALSSEANQGECYFRLAEYSQKKEFCLKAHDFQKDCLLHLFSRELFRSKLTEYSQLESLAKKFDISPDSIEGQTVIYRHILSLKTPIPIGECQAYPSPEACQRAAQGLYLDRLRFARSKNKFPCDELGDLDHSEDSTLLYEYQQMAKKECP